jgi:hypothetical protein
MNSKSIAINDHNVAQTYTDIESVTKAKTGWVFYCLVVVFWLGQLWCSPYAEYNNYLDMGNQYAAHLNPIMRIVDRILDDQSLVGNRFSLYEVSLVALACYILITFKDYRQPERSSIMFFGVSLFVVLLSLLNPNNSFNEVKYLITDEPRKLYLYLLFLYAFTFIRANVLAFILKKFFLIGSYAAIALAAYSLFYFLIGKGPLLNGSMTTLPNAQNLDLLIIFSSIFLALYLNSRKKIYLIYVILFHLVVIFGDRRTQTAELIASDLMLMFYDSKDNIGVKLTKCILPGMFVAGIVFIITWVANIDVGYFLERFYSALLPQKYYYGWYGDAGHWEQTFTTFKTLFANLDKFWGAGMRNEMNYVEGQSGYIHNSFVVVWAVYGLHMTLFYFFLLLLFLKRAVSFYFRDINASNMITASVVFTYLAIISGSAFTGEYVFKQFVYATQLVLIICSLKIDEESRLYI